jgi:hypothetical protein
MTREDTAKIALDIVAHERQLLPAGAGIVVIITTPHDKKVMSLSTNLNRKDLTAVLTKSLYQKS